MGNNDTNKTSGAHRTHVWVRAMGGNLTCDRCAAVRPSAAAAAFIRRNPHTGRSGK